MRALPRMFLAFWLFMIFGFCVYGFLVTYPNARRIFLSRTRTVH